MMKCSNLTRKSFFHRSPSLPSSLPSHVLSSCSLNFASVKPERPLIQKASLSCSIPWPTGFFFFLLRLRCHSSFAFLPHFRSDHILPVCTWECFCSSYTVPVRHLAAAMLLVHQTCTSSTYTDNEKHRTSNTFNREKKKKKGTLWNTIVLAASSRGQQSESSASMLPPRLPPLLKSLLIFSGLFCLPGSYRCVRNLKTGVKLNIL